MASCRFRLSFIIHPCTIGFFCSLFIMGCAAQVRNQGYAEMNPCTVLDSLYDSSGFDSAVAMSGKITFDVEQYRIRGQFTLTADANGEMGFDFSNSTFFGNQHEDISMSIAGGIVRVLDRERGKYYEGGDVDALLRGMIDLDVDVGEIVSLVLGMMPPCAQLPDGQIRLSRSGEVIYTSRSSGEDVRIVFDEAARTIRRLEWPLSLTGGKIALLHVDYDWKKSENGQHSLERLVLSVPGKDWRIKLVSI